MFHERMEPNPPMPLTRGECDWCGSQTRPGLSYCGPECRVAYNNMLTKQGKSMMQMLKVWRKNRGRKGTAGEGMIGEIASRVDLILEQDRNRKTELQLLKKSATTERKTDNEQ